MQRASRVGAAGVEPTRLAGKVGWVRGLTPALAVWPRARARREARAILRRLEAPTGPPAVQDRAQHLGGLRRDPGDAGGAGGGVARAAPWTPAARCPSPWGTWPTRTRSTPPTGRPGTWPWPRR